MKTGYPINSRQPRLSFLSDAELDEIHCAALEILERTGLNVHHPEARHLLADAGAYLEGDLRVRIPSHLVKRALHTAPERVVLSDRPGQRVMPLEKDKVYFGTGSDLPFTLDHETGVRRPSVLEDVARAARVSDALEHIDFVMSFGLASDVPVHTQEVQQFAAMLRNTTKPLILTQFTEKAVLEDLYEMACAVRGSPEELRRNPFLILYGQFISPLQHHREGLERLLFCAEKDLPIIYVPTILAGASGPATMAGALALGNAEVLAGLTIHQLKKPGAPFIYGGCICPFDMRTATIAYGAPEWHIASAILSQLSLRYRLPLFSTGGCTDSKVVDEQALLEGSYSLLLAALSGANLVHDVGYLEMGRCGDLSFLVMMNEMASLTRRILRPFEVNAETLALDLVDEVGPGGHFLEAEHTLRHFRSETWYPSLLDRQCYDAWQSAGATTLKDRARARVDEILRNHTPQPLPPEVEEELERILAKRGG